LAAVEQRPLPGDSKRWGKKAISRGGVFLTLDSAGKSILGTLCGDEVFRALC
jgi:hypothetical protein